jgi:hypothetical protein
MDKKIIKLIPLTLVTAFATLVAFQTDLFGQGRTGGERRQLVVARAGLAVGPNGIKVSQIRYGTAVLVAGTVTVSDTNVTANTIIIASEQTAGGTQGTLRTTRTAGTSFTLTSTSGADTSTVAYLLIEP